MNGFDINPLVRYNLNQLDTTWYHSHKIDARELSCWVAVKSYLLLRLEQCLPNARRGILAKTALPGLWRRTSKLHRGLPETAC